MALATNWPTENMLHSLRLRLLLAIIFVIAVALGSVALIGRRATTSEFQRYIDAESSQRGRAMAELLIYYRQNRSWANVEPLLLQMGQISGDRIILTDAEGRIIADSMSVAAPRSPAACSRVQASIAAS